MEIWPGTGQHDVANIVYIIIQWIFSSSLSIFFLKLKLKLKKYDPIRFNQKALQLLVISIWLRAVYTYMYSIIWKRN